VEELERLARTLEREVVVEHHLADAEDRIRELPGRDRRRARPQAEGRSRRERQERPVEVEVLAREVARQRLVGGDGIVRIAARAADGGGELVAERHPDTEAGADALAVPGGDVLPRGVRLVVEALVAHADVAEYGRALRPVGQLEPLLRL